MGRPAGDRLTPEVTREVCQRTGSKAMLTGSIAGLGSQYVIGLKAVNCNTGDVLAEAQEQAAGKEAVLKALDTAAVSLRGKLGESLSSVQKYATPLEEATTPSLEALKAYSLGLKDSHWKGAQPLCRSSSGRWSSTRISPWPTAVCQSLRQPRRIGAGGRECTQGLRAAGEGERAGAVLHRGKLLHDCNGRAGEGGTGLRAVAADLPEGRPVLQEPGTIFPTPWETGKRHWRNIARRCAWSQMMHQLCNLGIDYMNLNRLDEAEAVFKQAEERKLEGERLLLESLRLAFLKGDAAQMAHLASAAVGKPGAEDLLLATQADTEGWYGRLKNARELTRRAIDSAQHNDAQETAAAYQVAAALREVESGNRQQARADADAAMKLAPNH